MATVKGDVRLNDFMTRNLKMITQAVNMTVSELEFMQKKIGKDVDVSGLNKIRETVSKVDIELENAVEEQERLNKKVNQSVNSYSNLGSIVKKVVGALSVKKLVGLSDQNTEVTARLKLMSGGTDEQVAALQKQIFASAQRSRTDYFSTADVVSKIGMRAKGTFGNTNEIIQFSENLNKMFVIAGASQAEISSASLQLTQALGSGVLRGEELNAVFEAAPNIIQTIAKEMGVPVGKIRELASEGQITSDVIKSALLGATGDIEKDFKKIPMTWGQIWTMTVNKLIQISKPLLNLISLLAQNWEILEPIVLAVATAIGTYIAIQTGYNIVTGIGAGIETMKAASTLLHATAMQKGTMAAISATAAQHGLNAALLACPLTWFLIAVVAVIAVLIYLWNTNDKVAYALVTAWDTAILGVQIAVLNFRKAFYGLLDFLGYFKIGGLGIIDGFINGAILLINAFIEKLNKIPGVSIDTITWRSTLAVDAATEFAKEKAERDEKILAEQERINQLAEDLGSSRRDRVENRAQLDLASGINELLGDGIDIGNVANVENIEGEVDVASEDLKLIRELAEQQHIQNYISNAPVVYVTTGDINENADADYLVESVATRLGEEIDSSMEGVPVK